MTEDITPSLHTLMHYWERVITTLAVTWPLTITRVTIAKCGATYMDAMDAWQKLDHLQPCVIHAMLLAIQLNAWRFTRPKEEDRTCPCVTACYFVPTVVKLCDYKKRGWGLNRHTCSECYCFNCKFTYHPKEDRHLCYMHSIYAAKCQQKTPCRFFFYHFKSMLLCNGTHKHNLVVAQSICECCSTHRSTCSTYGHQCALCDK